MKKISNKGKEALAFEVMCAAADRILVNGENDGWYDEELKELAGTVEGVLLLRETVAKWMTKLPGKIWATDLPKVWDEDYWKKKEEWREKGYLDGAS
mgnify:CR=1 FL=1